MPRERTYLRYQLYRSKARHLARLTTAKLYKELEQVGTMENDLTKVRFEPISAEALTAYGYWSDDSYFSWDEVLSWKAREPMSFDVAIWFDRELCGLCFANPNQSRLRVRIVRLEGKPDKNHPLKRRVATLALIAVSHYARIIGSKQIEIQESITGAIPLYQELGFEFDAERRLVMVVESD